VFAFWMVGPSAIGSVKGIPSSITSVEFREVLVNQLRSIYLEIGRKIRGVSDSPAPPASNPSKMSTVSSTEGYPAVI
jgi:hypothetical protein